MKFQTALIETWSFVCFRLVYKRGAIRCRIFRKIETKIRYCAEYTGSDSNVWVTVFFAWSLLLCLFDVPIYEGCRLSDIHNSKCTIRHAYSNGAFQWGAQNRTENSLLLLKYDDFHAKYNIISGSQWTKQKTKAVHDPFMFADWHWTWNIPLSL